MWIGVLGSGDYVWGWRLVLVHDDSVKRSRGDKDGGNQLAVAGQPSRPVVSLAGLPPTAALALAED